MSDLNHTPGPWKAHFNVPTAAIPGHIIKTDCDVMTPIALLWEGGGISGKPKQIANANLIAAAPELLAALKYIDETLELDPFSQCGRLAAQAIAKAEGRAT